MKKIIFIVLMLFSVSLEMSATTWEESEVGNSCSQSENIDDPITGEYWDYVYYDNGCIKEKSYTYVSNDGSNEESNKVLYNPDGTLKEVYTDISFGNGEYQYYEYFEYQPNTTESNNYDNGLLYWDYYSYNLGIKYEYHEKFYETNGNYTFNKYQYYSSGKVSAKYTGTNKEKEYGYHWEDSVYITYYPNGVKESVTELIRSYEYGSCGKTSCNEDYVVQTTYNEQGIITNKVIKDKEPIELPGAVQGDPIQESNVVFAPYQKIDYEYDSTGNVTTKTTYTYKNTPYKATEASGGFEASWWFTTSLGETEEIKYYSNGYRDQQTTWQYGENGKVNYKEVINYTNGEKSSAVRNKYDANGVKTESTEFQYHSNSAVKTKNVTTYTNELRSKYVSNTYNTSGEMTQQITYLYHSPGGKVKTKETSNYSDNKRTKYVKLTYNTSGYITQNLTYYYHTNEKVKSKDTTTYDSKGKRTQYVTSDYDTTGNLTSNISYWYHSNGKVKQKDTSYYSSGNKTKMVSTKYDTYGTKTGSNTYYY